MGRGARTTPHGRSTLDLQIKQLPAPLAARPEESVDRLAGKVRDPEGRPRRTNAPYGEPSRSNRLKGVLVQGFPLTPS